MKFFQQSHLNFRKVLLLILVLLFSIFQVLAQNSGQIYSPVSPLGPPLDPDNNKYITNTGQPFILGLSEVSQFENLWTSRYQFISEPIGDPRTGSVCSQVDIVDVDNGKLAYFTGIYDPDGYPTNNNGNEYFLGRIRIGNDPGAGNFGYSILIDIDNQFGLGVDPNGVSGNPGFEIEIRMVNNGVGKGVYLDRVDGTTTGITVGNYDYFTHSCKAYAAYGNSGCSANRQTPVFIDLAVPFSDIYQYFGIGPNSNVRIAAATSSNGESILGNHGSDLAGVNDALYQNGDDAFTVILDNQNLSPIPIELTAFYSEPADDGVLLFWNTSSEKNNSQFIIEHRSENSPFNPIGKITGMGTSTTFTQYSFLHRYPENGKNYYRLKQVDDNGTSVYSYIIMEDSPGEKSAMKDIEINYLVSHKLLKVNPGRIQNYEFWLFSSSGKLIYSSGKRKGESLVPLNAVPAGIYGILIKTEGGNRLDKIVVPSYK